ncbi:hypothetical protein PRIPAC_94545 [Pristionchus pacificus]|uniref:Uncharacterized protein n=1 Tax=Pristionchus pacificus TaxID=54126 RepID=A0A454XPV1_PRIPA|nr:hypothetical protein PRIPAC_94545 [Pristionchus pacificus]|eukprot:PDM76256.1 hypothetical protein PRIPAC_39860 [Pristionchus pacificus]
MSANHLDSSDEEDAFERIEDMNDIHELDSKEEEETVRILEQELARLRSENEFHKQHKNTMTALVVILVIVLYAILIFGPRPCSSSPAEMAECPKISPCPPVSQCESKKCELRLCPDEQRVRVLMRFEDDLPKGFQVKDRVVTQIEEWTLARPALEVGHELVFVDGVNMEAKTDDEISAMIRTSGALIHTNLIVRNSTSRIDYTKEICFLMELGTVLFLVFCFIVNVFEKAVWARDKKTMVDNKKHSLGENNAESHKIVDLGEIASETINAQNVAIEDNRVELEMYEARLAAAKSELVTLEKRLKVVIEKTASIDEVEKASVNELDKLEKTLNECYPKNGEEGEELKAGVITRSHKRLSRSNGMFLDAPSLLA